MKTLTTRLLIALFFCSTLQACKSKCEKACDWLIECAPGLIEENENKEGGENLRCKWKDGEADAFEECNAACEEAYDKLSGDEQEEVDDCYDCLAEQTDDATSCRDPEDFEDDFEDECDNKCDDDDVKDFVEDFVEEAGLDDDDDIDDVLECK